MHAQSRKSEADVSFYIGITGNDVKVSTDDEESEVNGIVKKCNRGIVKQIASDILNGEKVHLAIRLKEVF
jgi:hypothetical protein